MSSTNPAPSKKSAPSGSSPRQSWLHRVREVQLSQITPAQRADLEEKCRARQVLAKKAKACKGVQMRSKNAVYHTMNVQQQMMQPLPAPSGAFGFGGGASGSRRSRRLTRNHSRGSSRSRSRSLSSGSRRSCSSSSSGSNNAPAGGPAPGGDGFGFGANSNQAPAHGFGLFGAAQLQATSRQAQASSAMNHMESRDDFYSAATNYVPPPQPQQRRRLSNGSLASAGNYSDDDLGMEEAGRCNSSCDSEMGHEEEAITLTTDDIDTVLISLRQEPKDDELMAAKFEVFEKFSEKVTVIRSALEEVAGSAMRDLPDGPPRQGVRNDLAKLEGAEMSGIYDQSRYWFVHDMMKQAAANCTTMDGMSNRIEALLKFAASNTQTDCPICLRGYTAGPSHRVPGQSGQVVNEDGEEVEVVIPKTLSCCHSVCRDCWTEWSALQGATAFCPLCRNKEFLQFLARNDDDQPGQRTPDSTDDDSTDDDEE